MSHTQLHAPCPACKHHHRGQCATCGCRFAGEPLLPSCALPGCPTPVATQGQPCQGCRDAFGGMLRENPGGQVLTAQAQYERDAYVARQYQAQAAMRQGGRRGQ